VRELSAFKEPVQDRSVQEPPRASGEADRYDHRAGGTQPSNLLRMVAAPQRERLFAAIAASKQGAPQQIIERQIGEWRIIERQIVRGSSSGRSENREPSSGRSHIVPNAVPAAVRACAPWFSHFACDGGP
jgi:hypothetical protein